MVAGPPSVEKKWRMAVEQRASGVLISRSITSARKCYRLTESALQSSEVSSVHDLSPFVLIPIYWHLIITYRNLFEHL
jgi:hypothetical protein